MEQMTLDNFHTWRFPEDFHVIGISGKKQSGKSTTSFTITDRYYENFTSPLVMRASFAEMIKTMAASLFSQWDFLFDRSDKIETILGKTKRDIYQTLGTEWGRNKINKNIWIYAFVQRLRRTYAVIQDFNNTYDTKVLIVDDLRFENEYDFLSRANNFIHIHMLRDTKEEPDLHASEQGIERPYDIEIPNYGSIEELNTRIEILFQQKILTKLHGIDDASRQDTE